MTELRTLYPPIEPYKSGMLDVGDGHRVYYERCGRRGGQAGGVPARRPRRRDFARPSPSVRPRALRRHAVRSARLRPFDAQRQPGGQHDLGPGRRHRAAARSGGGRQVAGVRRLLGLDAGARLRRDPSRSGSARWCCAGSTPSPRPSSPGTTSSASPRCSPTNGSASRRRSRRPSAAT